MSNQRPIFNAGLYGKANRVVMNDMMDGTEFTQNNQFATEYAYRASMPNPYEPRKFLARLTTATAISGGRWSYAGTAAVMLVSSPYSEIISAGGETFTGAINLREVFNSSGTDIDGMNFTSPAATVGPVGSFFDVSAWATTGLEALVEITVVYAKTGEPMFYFDRPNPLRCTPD